MRRRRGRRRRRRNPDPRLRRLREELDDAKFFGYPPAQIAAIQDEIAKLEAKELAEVKPAAASVVENTALLGLLSRMKSDMSLLEALYRQEATRSGAEKILLRAKEIQTDIDRLESWLAADVELQQKIKVLEQTEAEVIVAIDQHIEARRKSTRAFFEGGARIPDVEPIIDSLQLQLLEVRQQLAALRGRHLQLNQAISALTSSYVVEVQPSYLPSEGTGHLEPFSLVDEIVEATTVADEPSFQSLDHATQEVVLELEQAVRDLNDLIEEGAPRHMIKKAEAKVATYRQRLEGR